MADIQLLQIKDVMTNRPARIRTEDLRFMDELKHALLEGLKVFEELERETINQGSQRLMDAARAIPNVLNGYYARVYGGYRKLKAVEVDTQSVVIHMIPSGLSMKSLSVNPDPVGEQGTSLRPC